MLGEKIDDAVESGAGVVDGLGWLPVRTEFEPEKTVRRVAGAGYEIHHGRVVGDVDRSDDGRIRGTTVHGLFESDDVRRAYLRDLAARRGKDFVPADGVSFAAARRARFDALADAVEAHVDVATIDRLIAESRP
jgi:adenosylcobyric acid synthase